jgi:glycosyltransferase involved in cell wall biosynthesis
LAYGQDFTRRLTQDPLGIVAVDAQGVGVSFDFSAVGLVLAHDLEDPHVAAAIATVPDHIPIIAHLHLQWAYCSWALRENLSATLPRIRHAITPADFLADDLAQRFPSTHWMSVRNGVDDTLFRPTHLQERTAWRRRAGISDSGTLLAYVGRLENAKGLQVLEALAALLPDSNCHLLVQYPAWTGIPRSFEARARRIARAGAGRVHLMPDEHPGGDRPIRYCDLLVHPSLSEVAPRTVIESWMSGVPVVATRCTPFFAEIPELSFATRLVELPETLGLESLDRERLRIDDQGMATSLAAELLRQVPDLSPIDDQGRSEIARLARVSGFSAGDMVASLGRIYENVSTPS